MLRRLLVSALALVSGATFLVTAPADAGTAPAPAVTVTPGSELRHGDTIRIAATNFAPNTRVEFLECVTGFTDTTGCAPLGAATTGPFGATRLRTAVTVTVGVSAGSSVTMDCRTLPCFVVAKQGAQRARTFISFAEPANPKRLANPVYPYVERQTAIKYGEAVDHEDGLVDLLFDVYQPSGDARTKRPAVIWIFGGAFVAGNREQLRAFAEDSARRGFVAFAIDYRITTSVPITQAIVEAYSDAKQAAQFFRSHASDYRVDPERIFAAGYSAGAITALNLAYVPDASNGERSLIRGALSIAGFSIGAPEAGEPPSVMFHGTADTTVPLAWGRSTCNAAVAVGVECILNEYAGEDHLFGIEYYADINDKSGPVLRRWSRS